MIRNTAKTRRLWIKENGPIPKDKNGRPFEIHHVDGNRMNDSLENLICISIEDHYNLHEAQCDWMACHRIATRMQKTPEEISNLSKLAQQKRVEEGTHNFLGGAIQHERVANGTHHLLGGKIQSERNQRQWDDGTHCLIGKNEERIRNGTHNWVGPEQNAKKIAEGTHNWIQPWNCAFCGKSGKNLSLFTRWGHNDGRCLDRNSKNKK